MRNIKTETLFKTLEALYRYDSPVSIYEISKTTKLQQICLMPSIVFLKKINAINEIRAQNGAKYYEISKNEITLEENGFYLKIGKR